MLHINLFKLAIQAAVDAGAVILDIYYEEDRGITLKKDHTPVTHADLKSHLLIKEALKTTKIPVLSEEDHPDEQEKARMSQRYWLIDPLDGTHEFIHRNGEFTVNIALVERSRPTLGIIYIPCYQQLFAGLKDHGAWMWKNIRPGESTISEDFIEKGINLPLHGSNKTFVIVASKSHLTKSTESFITRLRQSLNPVSFIQAGSSLKFCRIATGEADLYPRMDTIMEWDSAAGQAIIEAAGGMVRIWPEGNPLSCNNPDYKNPNFLAIAPGRDASLFFED